MLVFAVYYALHHDRRFEVVNLALGGYDAYQLFERMRTDGVHFAPDLLIINSGINDVRNALFAGLEIPAEFAGRRPNRENAQAAIEKVFSHVGEMKRILARYRKYRAHLLAGKPFFYRLFKP